MCVSVELERVLIPHKPISEGETGGPVEDEALVRGDLHKLHVLRVIGP